MEIQRAGAQAQRLECDGGQDSATASAGWEERNCGELDAQHAEILLDDEDGIEQEASLDHRDRRNYRRIENEVKLESIQWLAQVDICDDDVDTEAGGRIDDDT